MTNDIGKIGIIGDTHFGAGYNMGRIDSTTQLNTRLIDFSNTFNNIVDTHIKQGVKTEILTGDIFETRHPTASQHKMFSKCIQRAVDLGLEVIINVGNHDQQRNVDTTTIDIYNSLRIQGVSVFQDMGIYSLSDDIHLVIMPYRDKRMLGGETNSEAISNLSKELNALIYDIKGTIIVVGHFMLGKEDNNMDPDLFSMNELILPTAMFNNCDMVIMGHIHKHEVISHTKPICIYSGSMERVSFGEKDHNKISIVVDPFNIDKFKIFKTPVRDLYELEFDYTEEKQPFKSEINEKVISDINAFADINDLKGSICKVVIRIKETDLYYINQSLIKSHVMSKNIHYCAGVHVSSINKRQLRNSVINETISGRTAMESFINGLQETEKTKKKLLKYADIVMDEVEGK